MKKSIFITGLALTVMAASAQNAQKDAPPKPPPPPKPVVKKPKEVPPPPPPPDAPPPPPVAPPPPPEFIEKGDGLPKDYVDFLKRNPAVQSLNWNRKNEVMVHLDSGRQETYRMDEKGTADFTKKYGALPQAPPPPPPPPAPKAPKKKSTLS